MKANFNGKEREFLIKRKHTRYLEHSMRRSLYAVLTDAVDGNWTFNDVAMVLSFALYGPSPDDLKVIGLRESIERVFPTPPTYSTFYKPHPDVIAALEREGHGNFAGLMADILTEVIFGETAGQDMEVPADAAD